MSKSDDLIAFLTKSMVDDGCIVIQPRREPFREYERDFIERIRRIPARIDTPPRMPVDNIAIRPGRWVMVWVPEGN